jgi:uncharacterized heparinase superfamily protein
MLWLRRNARGPHWRVPGPERLLFAPQDLRTSDPTVAQDIYGGLFTFAGRDIETKGRSPFELASPSDDWTRALYGFDWLRHLRAADTPLAREHGRSLVAEAIGLRRRQLETGIARETTVVGRRVISFLCQSPLVLNGADRRFYALFLRAIGRGVAALERDAVGARKPLDRLVAAIALSYAALCCSGFENRLRRATRLLSTELDAQILPDGGHVSRHPGVLVELLLDLLPLRLLYASRSIEAPAPLGRAIDRMMPMLRYLRGGRELALFNGMGSTAIDQVATLLSYDDVRGKPPAYAEQSGYARLEAGGTILLAETGAAPPVESAGAAHAGCLSFELSTGGAPLVVNVGSPAAAGPARDAARRTAAHSTLAIGQASSGLLPDTDSGPVARWLEDRLGAILIAGPSDVPVERGSDADGRQNFTARHDGYLARFGVTHERRWSLAADGGALEGQDRLLGTGRLRDRTEAPLLRFHLHPSVRVSPPSESGTLTLMRTGGEVWRFTSEGGVTGVEESIYYGGVAGWSPTCQIVVRIEAGSDGAVAATWRFERVLPAPGDLDDRSL